MRKLLVIVATVGFTLLTSATGRADTFPRPPELETPIRFWRDIFATYSRNQVVLHDAVDLNKVYKVLDFRSYAQDGWSAGEVDSFKRAGVDAEMQSLRDLFARLAAMGPNPVGLNEDEQRIYDLFKDDPSPERFLEAASDRRLHSQSGLRERFQEGLEISRRYLPQMEAIFREQGVPTELTRLPLIESCFNVKAYSKVGAAGIWQFMPGTGRLFLDVGDRIDERRDPITATRAAAQFLSGIYNKLGEWPLAITSYNHGPAGVARAVNEVGTTDIATIIREYKGPNFGFASRNFYVEFLAALEVDRNASTYFPEINFHAPLECSEHYLSQPVNIEAAARGADLDIDTLCELNPALTPPVAEGRVAIPAGYKLKVPADRAPAVSSWLVAYESEIVEREARERREAAERAAAARQLAAARRASKGRVVVARGAKSGKATVTKVSVTGRVGRSSRLQRGKGSRGSRT